MPIRCLNPLVDHAWDELVARHRDASVFHQRGWLEALHRTYGYEPLVLTSAAEGQPLDDGIALCRVSSWMTGTRLVALPFADHCQPLVDPGAELLPFTEWLGAECDRQQWRYVELRPYRFSLAYGPGVERCTSYWLHELDLTANLERIFSRMHKNSFRRNIRRAEREGIEYEAGRSSQLVDEFYRLLIKTRRRHHLLPQPRAWFRNLVECMGEKARIHLARNHGTPIAAMLSLRHGSSVVYKYGCSDASLHRLGAMPLLFWKLIQESKAAGAESLDLGRCDLSHKGLMIFKDRLGASKRFLNYYRHTNPEAGSAAAAFGLLGSWNTLFPLPDMVLSTAGRVLYKHLG